MNSTLYLAALMPPPELSAEIRNIQETFANVYHCKAGLKNKVHITVVPPFRATNEEEPLIVESLGHSSKSLHALDIRLSGFKSFRRNQVIYLDVTCPPELEKIPYLLQQELQKLFPAKKIRENRSFHPHITIGYRDIPRQLFKTAEADYLNKPFEAVFPVDRFYLWRHNGQTWDIWKEFPLNTV